MADNLGYTPGSGSSVATDDVGGVQYQRIKATWGVDGVATDAALATGLPVQQGWAELTGTAAANNTDLVSSTAALGYGAVAFQLTGTFVATVAVQVSNDNTTWTAVDLYPVGTGTKVATASAAAVGMWWAALPGRYLRIRTTAYTSGTVGVTAELYPGLPAVTDTELPPPAAMADAVSNPTVPTVGAFNGVYSGSAWDRLRTVVAANGNTGTGLLGAGVMGYDGAAYRRLLADTTGLLQAQPTPGTTGGWAVSSQTALTNTAVAVKAAAGTFGGYVLHNPAAATTYLQVWNTAQGSVVVGTTAPTYVVGVPAGATVAVEFTCGIGHATAITAAATTTATGGTAPATALVATLLYK